MLFVFCIYDFLPDTIGKALSPTVGKIVQNTNEGRKKGERERE
jgi:hypothetical protein